jgi:predicted Zn-ribbon and HTH transcriptional regulator
MPGMRAMLVWGWSCHRCKHEWLPRVLAHPRVCPKCKSPYWNRPRRDQAGLLAAAVINGRDDG